MTALIVIKILWDCILFHDYILVVVVVFFNTMTQIECESCYLTQKPKADFHNGPNIKHFGQTTIQQHCNIYIHENL